MNPYYKPIYNLYHAGSINETHLDTFILRNWISAEEKAAIMA